MKPLSSVLVAGGGTAGHVNPMLAVAVELRELYPDAKILALGTKEGLEEKLVPEAGFTLETIDRVPFPRNVNSYALSFPTKFYRALKKTKKLIIDHKVEVVFGVGGYVSTPAYLAAQQLGIPYVMHEANMIPGMANKMGVKKAAGVGLAFKEIPLEGGVYVGMPMKKSISGLDRKKHQRDAREQLGLNPYKKTLIVTGGSSGAQSINEALIKSLGLFDPEKFQILHIVGPGKKIEVRGASHHYHQREFITKMENVYAAADLLMCRAGSGTVSEVCAVGVPAIFVPLPVGNGEQKLNAQPVVDAQGALMIDNAELNSAYFKETVIPTLEDDDKLASMSAIAYGIGKRDADVLMANMIAKVAQQ
ncbi:MAG: undecaprenyldiphospho-muramoylpentapeptide beta-N-acetylglucosaminyltransferase [Micrococcaceae bacterium]